MTHSISSWPSIRLTEICRPKQWPTISSAELQESGYPVYGANGQIGYYSSYNHEHPTVLITCRGATCGTINVSPPKSYVTGNSMALDELDEQRVTLEYLVRALRQEGLLRKAITGSAQPQITRQSLAGIEILLPPLSEQKRVAAVLNQVDTLRAKRREAITLLHDLVRSLFIDMFGDPAENPKGWISCLLGELITAGPSNGLYKPAANYGRGVPILRIDSFQGGNLKDPSDWRLVDASPGEQERYGLSMGDIIINRVNSRSHLGKSVMVGDVPDGAVYESNMMRFRVDGDVALPLFVEQFLQTGYARKQVLEAAKDAVNQSSINQRDVKGLRVHVPPLKEQREYVRRVAVIREQVGGHQTHLATLDELFISLQQRAFSGTLWDHDGEADAA